MKRRIPFTIATALALALCASPAFADSYTPLQGNDATGGVNNGTGTITLNKYLVITGVQEVPDAQFEYEVTYPTNGDNGYYIAPTASNPPVYAGTGPLKVSADTTGGVESKDTLSFSASDNASLVTGPKTDETGSVIGNSTSGSWGSAADINIGFDERYVKKPIVLDFSSAVYSEPGVYRYWLQEIPYDTNPSMIANDAETEDKSESVRTWRTLDIYVDDDLDVEAQSQQNNIMGTGGVSPDAAKKLKVSGAVMYEGKLEAGSAPGSSFAFDITKNEARTTIGITAVTSHNAANVWTYTEQNVPNAGDTTRTTYAYVSSGTYAGKWQAVTRVTPSGSTTQGNSSITYVDLPPDAATSAGFPNKNFAQALDAEYKAQANAARDTAAVGGALGENGVEAGEKNGTFVNEFEVHELIVKKTVTGNQGSRDQYFKFTIQIDGAGKNTPLTLDRTKHDITTSGNAATKYTVDTMNAANSYDSDSDTTNGYQITTDDEGSVSTTVYLQHGEQLRIIGLHKEATYTITEEDANTDNYKTTIDMSHIKGEADGTNNTKVFKGVSGETFYKDPEGHYFYKESENKFHSFDTQNKYINNGTPANPRWELNNNTGNHRKLENGTYEPIATVDASRYSKEVIVDFNNNRTGVIPTGIIMSVSGGVLLAIIALAGLIFLNRRRAEED